MKTLNLNTSEYTSHWFVLLKCYNNTTADYLIFQKKIEFRRFSTIFSDLRITMNND
jgi:hypothetical protein